MEVEKTTPYKVEHETGTYYFCSRECAEEFMENMEEYTALEDVGFGE